MAIDGHHGGSPLGLRSVGAYRPSRVVSNDEICRAIDSSDEWIYTRTGIKNRRYAGTKETVTTMAITAARCAVDNAGLHGSDIDLVIVATSTNFRQTPSCAPSVATAIGAQGVPAFDVAAGCAGFAYALGLATQLLRTGAHKTALIIGSEKLSPVLDRNDRGNCFIFGDGAGAVVITHTSDNGIGSTAWGSDGTGSETIRQDIDWIFSVDNADAPKPYLRMDGKAVFRWAAYEMSGVGQRAMESAGVRPHDIDVFIPHQANSRINRLLATNMGLRPDVIIANDIEASGNTSAASIPLAMEALLASGAARRGQIALLLGYGSGLSYAASVAILPGHPMQQ
jgi:beta-ketoacyl ACP synthase